MIKKCDKCGFEDYPAILEVCPKCSGKLIKASLKEYVMFLYDKRYPLNYIAKRVNMNPLKVSNLINKELAKKDEIPRYVQKKYIDQIKPFVCNSDWDNKLKPIKEQLPKNCSYETIVYVVDSTKELRQADYQKKLMEKVYAVIQEGKAVEEISEITGANPYIVENAIVSKIVEDSKENAFDINTCPYIQKEYMDEILKLASNTTWNGKLSTLKASLPEDCTFVTIKGVLAVNGLLHM
jgi:DNA-binding Lrp family transcriptional regulator